MTAYPTVTRCARCGDLETAHEIRDNGTRGVRYGQTAGATSNTACTGWEPGAVEVLVPEGELRRRLAAVEGLRHLPSAWPNSVTTAPERLAYADGWAHATAVAVRAARGDS